MCIRFNTTPECDVQKDGQTDAICACIQHADAIKHSIKTFSAGCGSGYRDGVRNLEVMLESLSGGRRREIQEDGIVMEVKIFYLSVLGGRMRGELGEAKCDLVRHADCR